MNTRRFITATAITLAITASPAAATVNCRNVRAQAPAFVDVATSTSRMFRDMKAAAENYDGDALVVACIGGFLEAPAWTFLGRSTGLTEAVAIGTELKVMAAICARTGALTPARVRAMTGSSNRITKLTHAASAKLDPCLR